jgi:hypothetical protein
MMKQLTCFLFSLIILFTPVYNASVWLNYELNKERITDLFCINKEEPELQCNGTCHVKKTLITRSDNSEDQKALNGPISLDRTNLFVEDSNAERQNYFTSEKLSENIDAGKTYEQLVDIFHPPTV